MKHLALMFMLFNTVIMKAQTDEVLPYYEIDDYNEAYTANSVTARMVDGLVFGIIGQQKDC